MVIFDVAPFTEFETYLTPGVRLLGLSDTGRFRESMRTHLGRDAFDFKEQV